ncbi:cupin domain-containing protein [Dactylosporangium sp. CA-233914]|uniref:cupin domain-containing protein n=1 Tax=Dactylosporangium sp. CA-233914 TaxID=3239934 RepID=UPI003D89CB8B
MMLLEVPPGDAGTPPHRHSGPVFGYVLEGEMLFEAEGQPGRVIPAGEQFWLPGGDAIHYRSANNRPRTWLKFLSTMIVPAGAPPLTLVGEEELEQRRAR